jgi:hypothetical protein
MKRNGPLPANDQIDLLVGRDGKVFAQKFAEAKFSLINPKKGRRYN